MTTTKMEESEFDTLLREVEDLAAAPNPEETPYVSHYRIIEILNKWLTTDMQPFQRAVANAKLGATYLHVEEPHNAQPAFDKAAQALFPKLFEYATSKAPPSPVPTPPVPSKTEIRAVLAQLPVVRPGTTYLRHVVELLNQIGILWFNRSLPLRALCYFKACAELCAILETDKTPADDAEERESWLLTLRTHAYFYLAQVYGSLQLADESALYCLATLELQLQSYTSPSGDGDVEGGVHEWIKNALRLVDYYTETEDGSQAAVCLSACEYLLQYHLPVESGDGNDAGEAVTAEERDQRLAEMYVAWARLHQQTLQLAQLHREGVSPEPRRIEYVDSVVRRVCLADILTRLQDSATPNGSTPPVSVSRMKYSSGSQVKSYDDARDVFKMGAAACDAALKVFVLDGFVTAHIQLLQLYSQLYRRLISWETDLKRQIAMHLRRLSLMTPLLGDVISPRAYCAKLQELYYECGEVAVEIYDLKQFKKQGESDPKTTAYLLKAINWYQQYIFLFYTSDDGDARALARVTGQDKMVIGGRNTPLPPSALSSEGMTPAEIKAVLHGYFSLARACSKVVLPKDHDKTVQLWKKSMEYHEAVLALVKNYQQLPSNEANATRLGDIFKAEINICDEMLELLPEKINQLVYNGKAL